MAIPAFLSDVAYNRIKSARETGFKEYDTYWKSQGKNYQIASCYDCGRRTKHEPGTYHKYDPRCRFCTADSYAQMEAEKLSEQMGVC
jgi:hypothetical protein